MFADSVPVYVAVAVSICLACSRAGMDLLSPRAGMKSLAEKLPSAAIKYSREVSAASRRSAVLVAATVLSGAFVAGNDAGRAFNTFPLMGDTWIPEGILAMEPMWKNLFENTATVQFDHRYLAMATYMSITGMAMQAYQRSIWGLLPSLTRHSMKAVVVVANAQVALGISTLLLYVPIELAALHQVSGPQESACRPVWWCFSNSDFHIPALTHAVSHALCSVISVCLYTALCVSPT